MKKVLSILVVVLFVCTGSAWAVNKGPYTAKANITAPTEISMSIIYWPDRTLPATDTTINFTANLPAGRDKSWPGKTSWQDKGGDDGFWSVDGNVGFTAEVVGPRGTTLNVTCGTMVNVAGKEIPYSKDGADFFGFAGKFENGSYWRGSEDEMVIHSISGTPTSIFTAQDVTDNVYGHQIGIINLLKIPAYQPTGDYSTNGSGTHAHLMLTLT